MSLPLFFHNISYPTIPCLFCSLVSCAIAGVKMFPPRGITVYSHAYELGYRSVRLASIGTVLACESGDDFNYCLGPSTLPIL